MRQHLKRDICGLQLPGKLRSDVDQQTIDAALPPEAQYACRYWVHHLKESKSSIKDGDPVHSFLTSHFLYWLEALGLLGQIADSISMTEDLLALLDVCCALHLLSRDVLTSSFSLQMPLRYLHLSMMQDA
jgi:hypothetical protein